MAARSMAREQGESRGTCLMMVRPAAFAFDAETAATNTFQSSAAGVAAADLQRRACAEFDGLADALERAGVERIVFEDSPHPPKPSAVFPNNWVSFHEDGTVVLYPMATEGRRREVRTDWIEELGARRGFRVTRVLDWRAEAREGRYLEGTGSLVLDRERRVAFAALGPRTDLGLAQRFARELDYRLNPFQAVDPAGVPIYHTNVLMSVGPTVALACFEAIADPAAREQVRSHLAVGRRACIELSWEQLCSFAGNALEVRRADGSPILVMSAAARAALGPSASDLESRLDIVSAPLDTIERLGGGSARCMLAEVFLPRRGAGASIDR